MPVDPVSTRSLSERIREHRALLAVIAIAELAALVVVSSINPHDHIDGEVYRLGAQALLDGKDLYNDLPLTEAGLPLPFIYPPFAAILFTPLALVSKGASTAVIMLISHVALLTTLYVILRAAPFLAQHRHNAMLIAAGVLPLVTISEPVMETLLYAQINLVLMALVVVDCLWRTDGKRKLPYPRGLLIGIAAGIKLTPLIFLLLPLLRRDVRTIFVSLLSFAGTALIGFVVSFNNAKDFWLSQIFATSNVSFGPEFTGDASSYAGNQSMRSMLVKGPLPSSSAVFVLLAAVVLVLAVLGMVQALRQRDLPMAVTINGVLGLLLSPISWSHHWVWMIPAIVLVLGSALAHRDWPMLVASGTAAGFFVLGPHWSVPAGDGLELEWNVAEHLVGNAYVYFGLTFIGVVAWRWWQGRRAPAPVSAAADDETAVGAGR